MRFAQIAVIDDEPAIARQLVNHIERENAVAHSFQSGCIALEFIKNKLPDLIICDWVLKDIDGIDICRLVQLDPATEHIPFVMLATRSDEIDIVTALEVGAEDCVVKPVKYKELMARCKKILRRKKMSISQAYQQEEVETILRYKELQLNLEQYEVWLQGDKLDLTYSEFKLLQLLMKKPGKVYSRNAIMEKLNGLDYIATERAIDVQIVGLRKKLRNYKPFLETVRGVGYRFSATA